MILSKQYKDTCGLEHRRAVVAYDEARYHATAEVHHRVARYAAHPAEQRLNAIVRS